MNHSRIENLVRNYIEGKQEYIIVDISINGMPSTQKLFWADIRANCGVIFGNQTHGYKVYDSKHQFVFEYRWGISSDKFAVLGVCPANVDAILAWKGMMH